MDIQEASCPEVLPDLFVHKRIVQNLKGIDFGDDSDDVAEWTPTKNIFLSKKVFVENICNLFGGFNRLGCWGIIDIPTLKITGLKSSYRQKIFIFQGIVDRFNP